MGISEQLNTRDDGYISEGIKNYKDIKEHEYLSKSTIQGDPPKKKKKKKKKAIHPRNACKKRKNPK